MTSRYKRHTSTTNETTPDENFPIERNNSLPDAFGAANMIQPWEKFWSDNGERLIWASWIEKFSDYINPDYTKFNNEEPTTSNTKSKFNFDPVDEIEKSVLQPKTEIIVSSCSPAANSGDCAADGWNPLSPASVDDSSWNMRRPISLDADHLLSPRCESVTSSIPLTIGTTDSMTNVTHMTISSFDFGSGLISSVSSALSESNSSADILSSSTDSSTSSSQPIEAGDDAKELLIAEEDDAMDSDQHWQILWQKHFQEQYAKQYKSFMAAHELEHCSLSCSFHGDDTVESTRKLSKHRKRNRKFVTENLPALVSNLNLNCTQSEQTQPMDGAENAVANKDSSDITTSTYCNDLTAMAAMGLPTSFGQSKGTSDGGGEGNRNPNDRPINLKRRFVRFKTRYILYITIEIAFFSHESDPEEPNIDRVKAAFTLMGYSYDDKTSYDKSNIYTGDVVYRKKHIRLHNRILKMKQHKSKHTYFDDAGVEMKEAEQVRFHSKYFSIVNYLATVVNS